MQAKLEIKIPKKEPASAKYGADSFSAFFAWLIACVGMVGI